MRPVRDGPRGTPAGDGRDRGESRAHRREKTAARTGFVKTMWCGDLACEEAMKEQAGLSSRCMPFAQEHLADTCPVCGKPAKTMVVWGVAY